MKPPGYIAIEGPIGAGKTTLARQLGQSLSARLLLERPEDNPFLPRFYRDPAAAALPTQLCFLMQRAGQVEQLHQGDLFAERWVADFMFDKDRLFAELTLSRADYELYLSVFERLSWDVPVPDCVIYLHAPLPTLLERIARRGRDYEADIDPPYLERVAEAYGRYYREFCAAPLIEIDAAAFDLLGNAEHYAQLLQAIAGGAARTRLPAASLL